MNDLPIIQYKTLLLDRGLPGLVVDVKPMEWKDIQTQTYRVEWYSDYYDRVHDTWTFYPWEKDKLETLRVPPWEPIFLNHGFPPKYKRHIPVDWDTIHPNYLARLVSIVEWWEAKGNHNWRQQVDGILMLHIPETPEYAATLEFVRNLKRMAWMK